MIMIIMTIILWQLFVQEVVMIIIIPLGLLILLKRNKEEESNVIESVGNDIKY